MDNSKFLVIASFMILVGLALIFAATKSFIITIGAALIASGLLFGDAYVANEMRQYRSEIEPRMELPNLGGKRC